MNGNLDIEIATAALILAALLTAWAAVAVSVRNRRHSVGHLRRVARKEIRKRGLEQYQPTIQIMPDRGHVLILWEQDGTQRAILLTFHHMLDHVEHRPEETDHP